MSNSLGQDPYTVLAYVPLCLFPFFRRLTFLCARYINTACLGAPYENPAVDGATGTYDPPTAMTVTPCSCTKQFYSLVEACATCQGGNVIGFQAWSNACLYAQTQATLYAPFTTVIPLWAMLTIADAGIWDPVAAQAAAGKPHCMHTFVP